jgi:hypothetical protein
MKLFSVCLLLVIASCDSSSTESQVEEPKKVTSVQESYEIEIDDEAYEVFTIELEDHEYLILKRYEKWDDSPLSDQIDTVAVSYMGMVHKEDCKTCEERRAAIAKAAGNQLPLEEPYSTVPQTPFRDER